jgi:hypothetical protein
MTSDDEAEIVALMRAARAKARGYADHFGWAIDRDVEEWGVVTCLGEALDASGQRFFSNLRRRGRPNDPPDCEASVDNGQRIAIEVTELVDGAAIRAHKRGQVYDWAEWDKEKFLSALSGLLSSKAARFPKLKDPPYDGGYVVVVFTAEPELAPLRVLEWLMAQTFDVEIEAMRAFLLLSYDPEIGTYPYFELELNKST